MRQQRVRQAARRSALDAQAVLRKETGRSGTPTRKSSGRHADRWLTWEELDVHHHDFAAVAQDFARHNPELHTLGSGLQTGRTMIVFSRVLIVLNAFFDLIGDVRTPKRSAKPDFRAPARRQLTAGDLWRA